MTNWHPLQLASLLLLALIAGTLPANANLQITEFSSNPDESLADSDGDFPDWIELQNTGAVPLSTGGYTLTDEQLLPVLWAMPAIDLDPGEFLVVFASGKDRAEPAAELHTNFSLSSSSGYLALFEPDGTTVATAFDHPKQFYGLSFGAGGYFATPTPGAVNRDVDFTDFVRDTKFSVDRGFYDDPFTVEITTATEGAAIYYTTDGSAPTPTDGTLYTAPVLVNTTTLLRAIGTRSGFVSSGVDTQSYLFLDDVIQQPAAPAGFPATWGIDNSTNGNSTNQPRPADYQMDPEILTQFGETAVIDALKNHPTISIVMNQDDLWNESTVAGTGGLYPNPYGGTGNQFLPGWGEPRDWEQPCSVEFLGFEKVPAAQFDAGVRMAGNFARHPNRYKHHLRLTSRREYGDSKFRGQLFSRSDVDTFDDFIFRGGNSESWTFPNNAGTRSTVQYFRDQYYKDMQAAMGHLAPNQEYFHLYLNGLYWGFYTLIERVDAHWMSQHVGGSEEDYDIMKQGNVLQDGSREAWDAMFAISRGGVADAASYAEIQEYLDLDNLIDYLIFNFWAGTVDWRNNWRAGRQRVPGAGFNFFNWDGERGLGDRGGNREFTYNSAQNRNWTNHPTELHHDLRLNEEYRIRFADRVHKHLFNDGVLSPENAPVFYNARAEEVRPSLVAESARWGDRNRPNEPYTTMNEWQEMLDWMNETWFQQRYPIVLSQLRATDVFPDTAAPVFNRFGGQVAEGFPLLITNADGTVYFTTDGSDPRLVGGDINPLASEGSGIAEVPLIPRGATWRYNDEDVAIGTDWREPDFDDAAWSTGAAPIGYGFVTNTTIATQTVGQPLLTVYYRTSFELTDAALVFDAECEANIDGGAIIYLNGVEVVRDNMPDGDIVHGDRASSDGNEGVYDKFPIPVEHLVEGTNVIAVEGHNRVVTSSDMCLDFSLTVTQAGTPDLNITEATTVRARVLDEGEWSPLTEATFTTGEPASDQNLVLSEIFYNPAGPAEDGEFIELLNIGDSTISLAGVQFDRGIAYGFAPTETLAPGARLVLTPAEYEGQLANGGENLRLAASDGTRIRDFRYDDAAPWPTDADGDGRSLVLAHPAANPDHSLPQNWIPSASNGGTPNAPGFDLPPDDADLPAFFLGDEPVEITTAEGVASIRVPRNLEAGGATITIETSIDLQSWQQDSGVYQGFESSAMLWTIPVVEGTRTFARVRITLSD